MTTATATSDALLSSAIPAGMHAQCAVASDAMFVSVSMDGAVVREGAKTIRYCT
jgi:hypothetical protein